MWFNRQLVRNFLLLILGASLYTLASPPYEQSWAGWFALTPLFLVIHDTTLGKAFVAGLLFGVLFCLGIAYWVYLAVSTYFPLPFLLDLLCTIASYSVFVGVYTGLAAMGSALLMRKCSPLLCRIGVPACWVLSEFARSTFFSGFSWELLGYTQYRHLALIQIADLTGVYGVSFLLALSSYVLAEVVLSFKRSAFGTQSSVLSPQSFSETPNSELRTFPWPAIASLATALTVTLTYGAIRLAETPTTSATPPLTLALIKADVSSTQRWQRGQYATTLLKYAEASRQSVAQTPADLVVWPEFALGFYLDKELTLRRLLNQLTQTINTPLLLGAPRTQDADTGLNFYNSAYLLAPSGAVLDVYDKIRLLPFAESWPTFLPSLLAHSPEIPTAFTAGTRATVFSLPKGNFGVLICYEATYPSLARRLVHNGAQFLVNTSNDTWLAGEAASAQHFSMAVLRAVETRRPLARIATAGISGFVDPWGRLSQLSSASTGSVLGEVVPQQRVSVYVRYGDWFIFACAGWVVVAALLSSRVGWANGAHASFTHSEQPATVLPVVVTSPVQYNREENTPQPGNTP